MTPLSLASMLDPEVLANPYPLYHRLRAEAPVHWDPLLRVWVVTRYEDCVRVLREFSAERTPTPAQLTAMGLSALNPVAQVMVRQMLFLDPPSHTRIRSLAAAAFTPRRVEALRLHIRDIVKELLEPAMSRGKMDLVADLAEPLPCIVTAEMLGLPVDDHRQLKLWSQDFAEILGNFQHDPDHVKRILACTEEMTSYFRSAMRSDRLRPEGLVASLRNAEIQGDRLTEEEVIANCVITMVGGQETTTNLIANGVLALLRNPAQLEALRATPALVPSAVEELLRYESPTQYTARIAAEDVELGGQQIRKGQAVFAILGAGNRDPERFPDPDRLDITRDNNKHLAFGWGGHFCFGAPLARIEGQLAFEELLRIPTWSLGPGPLVWRSNLALRGLTRLPIDFATSAPRTTATDGVVTPGAQHADRTRPGEESSTLSPVKRALREQLLKRAAQGLVRGPEIPRRPDRGAAPLSFAQRQMWVIDQMTPGNPAYNLSVGYRLHGPLDATALQDSFNEVIKRHEGLRTTFGVRDGEPLQFIHPELAITLNVTELEPGSAEDRERRLHALASEETLAAFDLSRLPLIRVRLFKLAAMEHVLIITVQHIVADGLSIGLLVAELDAFYRAFTRGGTPRPPDLPVQYADFALWQRQALADEAALASQIAFWQSRLGGTLPVLELPADKPRPALQSFRGANVFCDIPAALVQDLSAVAAREGATFFMTMVAAFQVLLQRYSGADEIVIGTPVTARTPRELEPLIGNFLNMVALRCDLSGDPPFEALLRRTRDTTLDALSNSGVPFEALLKHLKFERVASRNPIFQVMLEITTATGPSIGDVTLSAFPLDPKIAQFDLSLHLDEQGGGYLVRFEYCTDVFQPETVERLSLNFKQLLHAIVKDPRQPISTLPILAAAERNRILNAWNETKAAYSDAALVHQLFEAQVERTPDRTALRVGTTALSYADLDARANRLAHVLRARGVARGARVGLCIGRGADMLAALLGILKTGAAYVPLDPSFPEPRLRFMADDAQLALIVSDSDLAGRVGMPRERQLLLDADATLIAAASPTRLPVDADTARSGDPAYVIYTSGSTGKPKGVVVPHRAVVNFLTSMAREPGLTADDVLLAVTTISFDIAVLELYLPLTLGATVAIATRDEAMDGQALRSLLEQHRASVMQATPVTWRLLLAAGWTGRSPFKALVGGETLPKDLADQLLAHGVELWNLYGPTETTVWSTCARITDTSHGITIGKPIANTIVRVLDARRRLCPVGVPGELCIGGVGVALGYWDRPALTASRFVRDPFDAAAASGTTLYCTGDRARWRPDGTLEHLGRLDEQLKLRGFRIEPGEIETAISRHPAVRDVAVVAREDAPGAKHLVAYLVAERPPADLDAQVRAQLRTVVPDYMVPSRFVMLGALPRTPNGKVDRLALPALDLGAATQPQAAVAPRTPTEAMVLEAFRDVLGRTDFGVFGNFFELGGHSLMAARLILRLRTASGYDVPLRVLFERQTVAELAEALDALEWVARSHQAPAITGDRVEVEL